MFGTSRGRTLSTSGITGTQARRISTIVSAVALLFLLVVSGVASASPLPGDPPPSIGSDKADYAPGSAVVLTGANWEPGEVVHVQVNDDQGMSWSRDADVTAAADGTVEDHFTLPDWFVASYSVKATGSSGLVATASFTDGNVSFALATAGQSAPSNVAWSVTWKHYSNSSCTTEDGSGTANYSGNTLSSGSQPSVGNNQWAKPTGATAPGYALDYWSSSPTSTTPLTSAQLCAAGPASTTLYAHLKPSKRRTRRSPSRLRRASPMATRTSTRVRRRPPASRSPTAARPRGSARS
jgi:hypothetical protein